MWVVFSLGSWASQERQNLGRTLLEDLQTVADNQVLGGGSNREQCEHRPWGALGMRTAAATF